MASKQQAFEPIEWAELEDSLKFRKHRYLAARAREAAAQGDNPLLLSFFRSLKDYLGIVQSNPEKTEVEIESLFLDSQLMRLGLHLKCTEGLASSVSEGDIIECYNLEHQQIFRNFEFFLHCSYSLVELTSSTWPELFERNASVAASIYEDVVRITSSEGRRVSLRTKPHLMRERGGRQQCFEITLKYGWPVFSKDGILAGYISTQNAKQVANENVLNIL